MAGGRHRAKQMTRNSYTVLAALMLADGAWVDRDGLTSGLFPWTLMESQLSRHIGNVRRLTGARIERRTRWGYRLVALPRDEHLDGMLACVPAVRRSAWWSRRTCRTRIAA